MPVPVVITDTPSWRAPSVKNGLSEDFLLEKRLTAVLCNGLFSPIDGSVASRITKECLDLCAGSQEALGQVLQTKFIGDHTPFYWIIANLSSEERAQPGRACPPLLLKLIEISGDLSKLAQDDIVQGLLEFSDDILFQLIGPNLTWIIDHHSSVLGRRPTPHKPLKIEASENESALSLVPRFVLSQMIKPSLSWMIDYHSSAFQDHRPTYKFLKTEASGNEFALSFNIPHFHDQLLIDKEIVIPFVAIGGLWYLKVVAEEPASGNSPIWRFELTEKESRRILPAPFAQFKRTISTTLKRAPAPSSSGGKKYATIQNVTCVTRMATPNTAKIPVDKWPNLSRFISNPFISHPERKLSGIMHVYDEVIPLCRHHQPLQTSNRLTVKVD